MTPDGKTDGIYVVGYLSYIGIIIIHHFQVILQSRNWGAPLVGMNVFSILINLYFIWRNDNIETSYVYLETFGHIFG